VGVRPYLAGWIAASLLAVLVAVRHRRRIGLFGAGYRAFLAVRWRLCTFAIAAVCLVVVAPHTGDPTWDYWDAAFMSALAFATAPWALGTLYRGLRGHRDPAELYLAACVWLFSTSWSFDLYILLRDGFYPPAWLANLGASAILYGAAGLFWNLDWRAGRGVTFAFLEPDWPAPGGASFGRVLGYATAFMALVTGSLVYVFLIRGY